MASRISRDKQRSRLAQEIAGLQLESYGLPRKLGPGFHGNPKARREIEDYCQNKVEEIASRLDPSQILADCFGLEFLAQLS